MVLLKFDSPTIMLGLRAVRSLRLALPKAKKTILTQQAARSIASSSRNFSDPPPTLLGPGSKPGAVPTDFEQATGLERLQLLGLMEGVDIFNTGPLIMTKMGTLKEPVMVPSYVRRSSRSPV
jgi:cytochrome c oxidase subunit 5b